MKETLVIITGTSCAGKTHQLGMLVERCGNGRVLTITDRERRPEEAADAYRFVSPLELNQMEKGGETIWVVGNYNRRYAISEADIRTALKDNDGLAYVAITPDYHAFLADWCRERGIRPINLHLVAPSEAEQRDRMNQRDGTVSEERIRETAWFEGEAAAATLVPLHFVPQGTPDEMFERIRQHIGVGTTPS